MKVIFILIFVNFVNSQMTFLQWQQAFTKLVSIYAVRSSQQEQAFDINCAFIKAFNEKYGQNFQLGFSEFSGLTFSEFEKKYLGVIVPSSLKFVSQIFYSNLSVSGRSVDIIQPKKPIPASIDYRNYSLAVQNQKNCGSCYAFAALSSLGRLLSVSLWMN